MFLAGNVQMCAMRFCYCISLQNLINYCSSCGASRAFMQPEGTQLKASSIRTQWWKARFPPFPISFQFISALFFFYAAALLSYSQLMSSRATSSGPILKGCLAFGICTPLTEQFFFPAPFCSYDVLSRNVSHPVWCLKS